MGDLSLDDSYLVILVYPQFIRLNITPPFYIDPKQAHDNDALPLQQHRVTKQYQLVQTRTLLSKSTLKKTTTDMYVP